MEEDMGKQIAAEPSYPKAGEEGPRWMPGWEGTIGKARGTMFSEKLQIGGR